MILEVSQKAENHSSVQYGQLDTDANLDANTDLQFWSHTKT